MLMSYVLDGGQFDHEIESSGKALFRARSDPSQGTGRHRQKSDRRLPRWRAERARDFAAERADAVFRLHIRLKARLVRDKMTAFYETIERPLAPVVAAMEASRDQGRPHSPRRIVARFRRAHCCARAHDLCARSAMTSTLVRPKQLGEVLFEQARPAGRQEGQDRRLWHRRFDPRRAGAASSGTGTGAGVAPADQAQIDLCRCARRGDRRRDRTRPHLLCTGRDRDRAVFVERAQSAEHPDPHRGGPAHPPRLYRRARAMCLLSADYSQIELRLAAHVADIPELRQAFRDGLDIHALTASQVFGVPLAAMDPLTRRRAKAINFGILYGISAFGLGAADRRAAGRGGGIYPRLFRPLPGDPRLYGADQDRLPQRRLCRDDLRPQMLYPRHSRRQSGAPRRSRAAGDQRAIAGFGGRHHPPRDDRIPTALAEAGLNGRMLLQVHDELLFEVPEAEVDRDGGARQDGDGGRLRAAIANCRCRSSSKPAWCTAGTQRIRAPDRERSCTAAGRLPARARNRRRPSC